MSVIPTAPAGLVIAIQYWVGDLGQAMRLAHLIADIEPAPRRDVTVALVRRFDLPALSALEHDASRRLQAKFPVMTFRSKRAATGHPDGCNALAAGTMDHLVGLWRAGDLHRAAVFLVEADGCPLRADWISCLVETHRWTIAEGKGVTGAAMTDVPHVNGSMVISFPWWVDHPSVHETPAGHAWDIFHADTFMAGTRRTGRIANYHGGRRWEPATLTAMSREVAWLSNTKDTSALAWAEKALVPGRSGPACEGCGRPLIRFEEDSLARHGGPPRFFCSNLGCTNRPSPEPVS